MTNEEAIERVTIIKTYGGMTIPVAMRDIEALDMAINALDKERPQGEWESLGFVGMKYAWCRCSNCHKTTKIYMDSSNEFCCIADIRKKAVACLYCGAKMRKETKE